MRLLLDTHAFVWWLAGAERLSVDAKKAIGDERNEVFVSAASAWEIATKHRLGRLFLAPAIAADMDGAIAQQNFTPLPVTVRHGQAAGSLPGHHRDPFDRMLIAQAMLEGLLLVSNDRVFDSYGASRLW